MICPVMSWRQKHVATVPCAKERCAWWVGSGTYTNDSIPGQRRTRQWPGGCAIKATFVALPRYWQKEEEGL
jgi:hypothetical protein